MKSVFAGLLIAGVAAQEFLNVDSSNSEYLARVAAAHEKLKQTSCSSYIDRIKKGPIDYKSYIKNGLSYTDNDFPAELSSISPSEFASSMEWDRARNIVKNASTFGELVDFNDIFQGKLGDCYFLASCAAIA